MRNIVLVAVFMFLGVGLAAQQQNEEQDTDVTVGTVLTIGKPADWEYRHIQFPRRNMIIKRGGIATMKSVQGEAVLVTGIKKNRKGVVLVTLKRADGRKFFNTFSTVKATLHNALAAKELYYHRTGAN